MIKATIWVVNINFPACYILICGLYIGNVQDCSGVGQSKIDYYSPCHCDVRSSKIFYVTIDQFRCKYRT